MKKALGIFLIALPVVGVFTLCGFLFGFGAIPIAKGAVAILTFTGLIECYMFGITLLTD